MSYEPKQNNRVPEVVAAALLVCAIVCAAFGSLDFVIGRGFLQALALVFFCADIFVLVKYKMTRTRYTLRLKSHKGYVSEDGEDGDAETEILRDGEGKELPITAYPPHRIEFVVEKAQGRRAFITECVIALEDINSCEKYPASDKALRKEIKARAGKGHMFRFVRNLAPSGEWFLTARSSMHENVKIIFEPNDKFGEYLAAVASYNKEQRIKERRGEG